MKNFFAIAALIVMTAYGCGSEGGVPAGSAPASIKASPNKNKALVVYYSRTGNTRIVAETLRALYDADLQEIRDLKDRSGIAGFIGGMVDVKRNPRTDIAPKSIDLSPYDCIVICSPTWGMKFAPAITTFMDSANFNNKKVVFVAVAAAKMKSETFTALDTAIVAKGGKAVGSLLVKTMFENAESLKEETKKQAKACKAFFMFHAAQ